jgi:hypothetical protein
MESMVHRLYPKSMKHLQQLIMDCEGAAKNFGKKTIFGKDKYAPRVEKVMASVGTCLAYLHADGHVTSTRVNQTALDEVNTAMKMLESTYDSWPLAFKFWNDIYPEFRKSIDP